MVYVDIFSNGLKVIYSNGLSMLFIVINIPRTIILNVVFHKDYNGCLTVYYIRE